MADYKNEIVENHSNDIMKQTAEVDDLITMLKNLEPLEKRGKRNHDRYADGEDGWQDGVRRICR